MGLSETLSPRLICTTLLFISRCLCFPSSLLAAFRPPPPFINCGLWQSVVFTGRMVFLLPTSKFSGDALEKFSKALSIYRSLQSCRSSRSMPAALHIQNLQCCWEAGMECCGS